MKLMIIEYNNTNEVLFVETGLGNYHPMAHQSEEGFQGEEVAEEVLLVLCSAPIDLTHVLDSIEVLIESEDEESYEDGNLRLLDGF